uniref:Haemolymph juvenile hormone binding protein n=1 Tax=Glossina palpalis gambiensis TaxID=67801 RepID=A0A1B0BD99_9MUSC
MRFNYYKLRDTGYDSIPNVIVSRLTYDPKPCNYGDNECIKKVANLFIRDSSIGLVPVDPLTLDTIHIRQGAESPLNIDFTLTNNKLYGVSNAIVTNVKGFGKDFTKKNSLVIKVPGPISLIGEYAVSGKVLILPMQGEGKSNITFVDAEFRIDFTGAPEESDGNTYMKLENFHCYADPKSIIFDFENLFNGDKALGDNMNKFLNENWKEIFTEIEDSLDKEFGVVVGKVVDKVLAKYPYAKYFNE